MESSFIVHVASGAALSLPILLRNIKRSGESSDAKI
jgi:hypothetical protein